MKKQVLVTILMLAAGSAAATEYNLMRLSRFVDLPPVHVAIFHNKDCAHENCAKIECEHAARAMSGNLHYYCEARL